VANEDTGLETTLPELQRTCVLLVARDIAAHVQSPLREGGLLGRPSCEVIRRLMHRVWAPAVRMVCQDHLDCEALGVDFRGRQLLDVCRVMLGSTASIVGAMPQAHARLRKHELCNELKLLTRLCDQRADFDCEI